MSEMQQREREPSMSGEYKGNIYFNGFEVGFSNSDASITLRKDSETMAILNLSFGTLKTLAAVLKEIVKDIEDRTGHIVSIDEFKQKMQESLELEKEKK